MDRLYDCCMTSHTYRHRVTGLLGTYTEEFAAIFPDLVLVDDDAKPLAYVPIEQDAIDELREAEANAGPDEVPATPSKTKAK